MNSYKISDLLPEYQNKIQVEKIQSSVKAELTTSNSLVDDQKSFNNNTSTFNQSKWSKTATGGSVLSDPQFQSIPDFHVEYRLWSQANKKNKKNNSILNLLLPSSSSSHQRKMFKNNQSMEQYSVGGDDFGYEKKNILNSANETQRLVDSNNRSTCDEISHDDFEDFEESKIDKTQLCNWSLYKGIIYSSLSSVFFSLSAVIVKYLKDIHAGELAVCRFVGIFVLTIPLIIYYDLNPFGPPELRPLLIMRGIAGATSLFLRFLAYHYLPIADASVIIFSVPVFVSIFAWIYLKEPCGFFHTFTIAMAMIGLMMSTKLPYLIGSDSSSMYTNTIHYINVPNNVSAINYNITSVLTDDSVTPQTQKMNHFYGVLSALSSLIFSSAVFIFIRKAKGAHHAVIMFNFGWVAILETTIITAIMNGFSMPRNRFEWYLIVVLGLFSFCGQMLLTRSLQLEQAGPVSVVRATTDIALAFIWQLIIFKETPDMWSVVGALLVSSCILLTALRKWIMSLSEHSKLKEKLYFLLL